MAPLRALIHQDAEGSALGASFIAVFGAIWAFAGASALGGEVRVFVVGVAVALATALVLQAIRLRRAAAALPHDESRSRQAQREQRFRRFSLVNGPQSVAIVAAGVLLGRSGQVAFIPMAIAFIVGVHFSLLAALFGVKVYRATGAALCALAVAALFVAPPGRLALVGLGSAAALFATGAHLLSLLHAPQPHGVSQP